MNMTSRYSLLAGVAGLIWAGCSAPAEEVEDPPTLPPPGYANAAGTTGNAPVASAGAGGTAPVTPPAAVGGTGGTAPVAAGGSAGAPVAAGGAGGGAGGGAIPTGSGNALTHDAEGWVAGTTNGLGIQGSFHTISDTAGSPPGVTTVALDDLSTPTTVCASGEASQVLMEAYGQYWGGGVGFNLADPGGGAGPGPWTRNTVTGFSFTLTGPAIPAGEQMRFKATTFEGGVVNEDGYCTFATAGANTVQFGDLVSECWTGGAGAPALGAATQLVSLQWQVATVTAASTPFDFCIENLTALTTP
jgi:hypothetical protein